MSKTSLTGKWLFKQLSYGNMKTNYKHMKYFIVFILCCSFLLACNKSQIDPAYEFKNSYNSNNELIPWVKIPFDKSNAGSWVISEDLDGDGIDEIISAKNVSFHETGLDEHYTSSIIVKKIDGTKLWGWGNSEEGRNAIHHDVACQIIDWDNDGKMEVILATDQYLIELDGENGMLKRQFKIPKYASDCILFGNFSEHDNLDIVVKNRYSEVYVYNYDGVLLWEFLGDVKLPKSTAHYPLIFDLDNDGFDDMLVGYSMLDEKGIEIWNLEQTTSLDLRYGHMDCARLIETGAEIGDKKIVITGCTDNFIAMINGYGVLKWALYGRHYESLNIANVFSYSEKPQIIVDLDHEAWGAGPLWILDYDGNFISEIITDYSRFHTTIDWNGTGIDDIIIGESHSVYSGDGIKLLQLEMPFRDEIHETICLKKDIDNDGYSEVLLYYSPLDTLYIYKTENHSFPDLDFFFNTFY